MTRQAKNVEQGIRNKFGVGAQGVSPEGKHPPLRMVIRGLHPAQSITREETINLVAHLIWYGQIDEHEIAPVLREVAIKSGHPLPPEPEAEAAPAAEAVIEEPTTSAAAPKAKTAAAPPAATPAA
jgi:hypothetical protein